MRLLVELDVEDVEGIVLSVCEVGKEGGCATCASPPLLPLYRSHRVALYTLLPTPYLLPCHQTDNSVCLMPLDGGRWLDVIRGGTRGVAVAQAMGRGAKVEVPGGQFR